LQFLGEPAESVSKLLTGPPQFKLEMFMATDEGPDCGIPHCLECAKKRVAKELNEAGVVPDETSGPAASPEVGDPNEGCGNSVQDTASDRENVNPLPSWGSVQRMTINPELPGILGFKSWNSTPTKLCDRCISRIDIHNTSIIFHHSIIILLQTGLVILLNIYYFIKSIYIFVLLYNTFTLNS
jgi:hypothetical protein